MRNIGPRALLSLLFLFLAHVLPAARVNEVRLAEHNGFTRLVVEYQGSVKYRIHNQSHEKQFVTVELDDIDQAPARPNATGEEKLVADTKIEYDGAQKRLRIHLKTPGPVKEADFRLLNPSRIVIDFQESLYVPNTSVRTSNSWRKRIVIDPGHGGYHMGGVGSVNGRTIYEKEITIKVAAYLEDLLRSDPRFEVALTRRQDVYVGLFERTEIAAKLEGDLFMSLHCNAVAGKAAQARARGFEIWVWNRDSNSSAAAKALAKLENADPGISRENSDLLTNMMIDALESQSLVSRRFAAAVHEVFMRDSYFRKHDRGIQAARFKVLENYDMPSILVEMGFITHPEEAKLLNSPAFQKRVAGHLYAGIIRYYEINDPTFPRAPNLTRAAANAK